LDAEPEDEVRLEEALNAAHVETRSLERGRERPVALHEFSHRVRELDLAAVPGLGPPGKSKISGVKT
jgi:hypothetical protein